MDEKKLVQEIDSQFTYLKKLRKPWEDVWKLIGRYIAPRKELFQEEKKTKRGQAHGSYIYDGTPLRAALLMAEGLQGHLVTPQSKWQRLKLSPRTITKAKQIARAYNLPIDLEDDPKVKEWLQESDEVIYSLYQRSNFYETISEFFLDAVTIGTATIFVDYDYENLSPVYQSIHPDEIYIAENHLGVVDTVFRHYKMTIRQAMQEFGEENLDHSLKEMEKHTPHEEIEFLHVVKPRTDRDVTKKNAQNKRYASYYIDYTNKKLVRESGMDSMKYIVWRYRKNSNELYGKSPSWDALYDAIVLNQEEKSLLRGTQLAVDPIISAHDSLRGQIRKDPGVINYYQDMRNVPEPWNFNGNFPVGEQFAEVKRRDIKEIYRVDFFMMLQSAERQMTATEILERQGEKAVLLGPAIGRLNNDALEPNVDLAFAMAVEAGEIPPIPDILAEFQDDDLSVDFVGPLAQAQELYLKSQPLTRALQTILPYAQFWPEVAQMVKPYEAMYQLFSAVGGPQDVFMTRDEFDAVMQQIQQQQQAAQQGAAMQEIADAYPKLSGKPEIGSPAEAMIANGLPM